MTQKGSPGEPESSRDIAKREELGKVIPENNLWTSELTLELQVWGSDGNKNTKQSENWTNRQTTLQVGDRSKQYYKGFENWANDGTTTNRRWARQCRLNLGSEPNY